MAGKSSRSKYAAGCAGLLCLGMAHAQQPASTADGLPAAIRQNVIQQGERLDAMRSQLAAQMAQIEQLKRALAAQEADYRALRHEMGMDSGDKSAGTANTAATSGAATTGTAVAAAPQPVGRAPVREPETARP